MLASLLAPTNCKKTPVWTSTLSSCSKCGPIQMGHWWMQHLGWMAPAAVGDGGDGKPAMGWALVLLSMAAGEDGKSLAGGGGCSEPVGGFLPSMSLLSKHGYIPRQWNPW